MQGENTYADPTAKVPNQPEYLDMLADQFANIANKLRESISNLEQLEGALFGQETSPAPHPGADSAERPGKCGRLEDRSDVLSGCADELLSRTQRLMHRL